MIERERLLYEQRSEQFVERLKNYFYADEASLQAEYCVFEPPVAFPRRLEGKYNPIQVGQTWGSNWQVAWFHLHGVILEQWKGLPVVARLNLGGEGCIFDQDGTPVRAISVHSIWLPGFKRDRVPLVESAKGGEQIDLWIEVTAAQLFGLALLPDPSLNDPKRFGHHEAKVEDLTLAVFRPEVWQLYLDAFVLNNLMKALPEKSVRRARILYTLNRAIDVFQGDDATVARARLLLKPELEKKSNASDLKAYAVGHAHLDTAWLWPVSETIRKCARTFSTQIALIEKYPEYVFGASQAQQYAFMKEHYPSLFAKIKEQVAAGRWEVQGAMWVEPDCNLISGESMVRQLLYGKKFFKEEFGVTPRNLWLPDVFGYSAALPQILKKSGIEFMVTQKLSWNQFNRLPHHTFLWRGIDGSEIIVHFPPEDNYNSELKPAGLIHAQQNFEERDRLDEFLVLFGIGDGGGGPTEDIIETGRRLRDLEGCPRVEFGQAQAMLDRLTNQRTLLKRWVGELYFELHRGTLTTQAFVKKMNRYLERKMRELEVLYSLLPRTQYPAKELEAMWKKILLNQFHDILPGSSIAKVYETAHAEYRALQKQAQALFQHAGEKLLEKQDGSVTLINTLSYSYRRPITLPATWAGFELVDEKGENVAVQETLSGPVVLANIPPLSAKTFRLVEQRARGKEQGTKEESDASKDALVLENDFIRYEFAADGTIKRAFDKECRREVVRSGNLLRLYEDRPLNWDAWDIDIYYENQLLEQARLIAWQRLSSGPLLHELKLDFEIGASRVSQIVTLAANSKRLEFKTRVDLQERHKMLRVSFATNVVSTEAAYEIQYGYIKRPTHRNTSWDLAKFECVGHRFVDLSEQDYGVALLNNCKYGHKVLDGTIELNLLRAPTSPDPEADRGPHEFTYCLLPHNHDLPDSCVFSEAAQLNQPVAIYPDRTASQLAFPVALDSDRIELEVLKKAESDDSLILRLYEPRGRRSSCTLMFIDPHVKVEETDLMENTIAELKMNEGKAHLEFGPFEIKTLKIENQNHFGQNHYC
ncbi:MAG: alpha-mannosidase [candidate division KSB1 bacterium]|nr:alpha-mannosidase [candidate division KSB1 bacterium]MDZ7304738.1 alpha-mannosidase [candidate division KSB1 bacterium]MDZ7313841.1 alpha-mannosidase [candidate division KSB1 bacterium]